ncbi:MAG: ATP-binding protein [Leptolyngbyaceae bacterium]|nr:ATP-binding protein [Leptolyngbyaceae bacterium]
MQSLFGYLRQVPTLSPHVNVAIALAHLRDQPSCESPSSADRDAKELENAPIDCVVVMEQEKIVGVLTERDLVQVMIQPCSSYETLRVGDVMSTAVVTLRQSELTSVEAAIALLRQHHSRCLLVVDEGDRLVGVITLDSLLDAAYDSLNRARQLEAENQQLRTQLTEGGVIDRIIIDNIPDLLIQMDREGNQKRMFFGRAIEVKYPRGLTTTSNVRDILPPDLVNQRLYYANRALETGAVQIYEHVFEYDGHRYNEEIRIAPLTADDVLVIIRDINAQKEAEAQLQKLIAGTAAQTGTDFFPVLVSRMAQALNVDYAIATVWMNGKLHSLGFYANHELQPNFSYDLAHTPCEKALREEVYYCEDSVRQRFPEDKILTEMGVESYLGVAMLDAEGNAIGHLCILHRERLPHPQRAREILNVFAARAGAELERQRAIVSLEQLNKSLEDKVRARTKALALTQTAVDRAAESVFMVRADGRFSYVNKAACQMSGYTQAELLQRSIFDLDINGRPDEWQSAWHQKELTQISTCESRYRMNDGREVPVEISKSFIQFEDTKRVLLLVRDITRRKQSEHERHRIQQQLTERNHQLALSNEELARVTRLKDEFLANMSHELRTPLNAILGMEEGLREGIFGPVNAQQLHALKVIDNSGHHLLDLINDILDIAKIESGHIDLSLVPISVESVCEASLLFVRQQAMQKHIQLDTHVAHDLPKITVDERRIRQVLINLLNNAVKFTHRGGHVTLETRFRRYSPPLEPSGGVPLDCVQIVVKDTGIGIAPEHLSTLFEPFRQVDSALSRNYEGTGLGLALAKQLVELHNGRISVSSELGVGSCFTVELPCDSTVQNEGNTALPATVLERKSLHPERSPNHSPLVLLAEDNDATVTTISSYLSAKGYRTLVAKNGREAVSMMQSTPPDIVLMDIQMPDTDGFKAIRHIREDVNGQKIPIIALTALAMPGDREQCLAAGADDYISKPFTLKQLLITIQHLLALKSSTESH